MLRPPGGTLVPQHPKARGNSSDRGRRTKSPSHEKPALPDKSTVRAMINELHAELVNKDAGASARRSKQLCRQLSDTAAERLGLIITGAQATTAPQVVTASVEVLRAAGIAGLPDRAGNGEES